MSLPCCCSSIAPLPHSLLQHYLPPSAISQSRRLSAVSPVVSVILLPSRCLLSASSLTACPVSFLSAAVSPTSRSCLAVVLCRSSWLTDRSTGAVDPCTSNWPCRTGRTASELRKNSVRTNPSRPDQRPIGPDCACRTPQPGQGSVGSIWTGTSFSQTPKKEGLQVGWCGLL